MAGPVYIADPKGAVRSLALDGLSILFHEPSGMTHIVAPPAPEILEVLQEGPASLEEILARLEKSFEFEPLGPSPFKGEGRVGVNVNEVRDISGDSAPPLPLPIKGRGEVAEALAARLEELETAGLVRRA